MALNKLKYNSLNVTPVANKAISFDSDPDALEDTLEGGAMTFISKSTASSSSTISFTSGIDSTYKEYMFIFKDIHPATDGAEFQFQCSTDSGSNYNTTITSSYFRAGHDEGDVSGQAKIVYETGHDLAQGTGFQTIGHDIGNDSDQQYSGILNLFNPSSTTFVKHFISVGNLVQQNNYSFNPYVAGYCNTTSAVDAVQFKFSSGNIDAGTITLYGIN